VVIDLEDFDIIIGMNWMTKHDGFIRCNPRSIELKHPSGSRVVLSLHGKSGPQLYTLNAHVKPELEAIPVVCEFPDVFPEELPGMPPDQEVNLLLSYSPRRPQFPEDPIECHLMSFLSYRNNCKISLTSNISVRAPHLGDA
jgi:hypothetical protein